MSTKTLKTYVITYAKGGKGFAGYQRATSQHNAKYKAAMEWGGRMSDYRASLDRDNPSRSGGRKLTKLEKKVKSAKLSAKRRVAVALAKFLRQANPAKFRSSDGAAVRKTKNGISITFHKRGRKR